jgi:UDP-N-acetylglucosamine 2-epimerase (non-hydrolysing)
LKAGFRPSTRHASGSKPKVLCVFGTRPEVIKLAPVIQELRDRKDEFQAVVVDSGQHTDLLTPLLRLFRIRPNFSLEVMQAAQTPNDVCSRVLAKLNPIIQSERPDLILVQGDTTTAMAAALTGFHNKIPVGHVEAGLRSGDPASPFPEEMNRRLVSQLSTYHFAATQGNRKTLLQEGIADESIFVTGNPVVDSLHYMLGQTKPSARIQKLLKKIGVRKLMVLTTHRRESFGGTMRRNLQDIRRFVDAHEDVALVFAVHPNPNVKDAARAELDNHPRILLIQPLDYADFIQLIRRAWLLLSDSGGIQEEAPSLGKPLFVLRNNTERPEAIESGVAFLIGDTPGRLTSMLRRAYEDGDWLQKIKNTQNPFGDGNSGKRIVDVIQRQLCRSNGVAAC